MKLASFLNVFLLFILSFNQNGHAQSVHRPQLYNYNYWVPKYISQYLTQVDQNKEVQHLTSDPNTALSCKPVFKNILKNGVMDIRYALGYFDDSQGNDVVYEGVNYGISPSLDIQIYNALREYLILPCATATQKMCGFVESNDPLTGLVKLSKNIDLFGSPVEVVMTLTHASASESFIKNTNELAAEQNRLALQSEQSFFDQIGIADVLIYNGHSRNGGGPDFRPPILDKTLHVDYNGYYEVKKIGINRVLKQIRQQPNKDSILGLFSCYSHKHFYKSLLKANPKQKLVLSTNTIDYFDSLYASLGLMEGLLRGQCGENLNKIIQQNEKLQKGYKGFQIE